MLSAEEKMIVEEISKGAVEGTLETVYWNLKDYAKEYRKSRVFKLSYNHWRDHRDDPKAHEKHMIHEFFAQGVESSARRIADLLGVNECQIERPVDDVGDDPETRVQDGFPPKTE